MLRLKRRRGAFIVLTAILTVSMMAMVALSVDFSRMGSLRNELQTSADASALAGAIQLLPGQNQATAYDSAQSYAIRNQAMQGTVTVDSIVFGQWDDVTRAFTPAATPYNAVSTVVSRQTTGLTMTGLLGVPAPRIKARATAWSDAPIISTGCIKPFAIPYPLLMNKINQHNGVPSTTANLTRPFTQADLDTMLAMPVYQREFDLHLGTGILSDPAVDSLTISGNYQAIKLGKYWDAATGTYANPGPVNGAQAYRDNVAGATCYPLSIGDSVQTNQGLAGAQNTVDPFLIQGNPPSGICTGIRGYSDNTPKTSPAYGDCVNASGGVGVTVDAVYYMCATGCTGSSVLAMKLIAAFTVEKVYPAKSTGKTNQFDMAQIHGTFSGLAGTGRVGSGNTASPVVTVVLVK